MNANRNIIFVAEQRGGFDAFLPVIQKIRQTKKAEAFLFSDNKNVVKAAGQNHITCKFLKDISLKKIEAIVKKVKPDVIFTDTNNTDFKHSADKKFIEAGKKMNVKTLSMVESFANLKPRFGLALKYLPDAILAADQKMKRELVKIGIRPNIVKVVGNPRFDKFCNIKKAREDKNLTVFYSQPLYGKKPNEVEIFKDIIWAIEKTHPDKKVVIKFHPSRETNDRKKYDSIIKKSKLFITKAKKDAESEALAKRASLVVGINSVALVDAVLMGKKVISYQPFANKKNDELKSNIEGWSLGLYKKSSLVPALKNIFKKLIKNKRQAEKYIKNNSTQKVINFIKILFTT